jgi:hypothetical protein
MTARHIAAFSPTVRVGMPLVSGELFEYGVASRLPLMFSANAFSTWTPDREFKGFRLDAAAAIPDTVDATLDSAGFTQAVLYGDYVFSVEQYLDLAAARTWRWYSSMDYCVEPQVAPDAATRRLRIEATVARYFECVDGAIRRNMVLPVPVAQGFFAEEYAHCAEQLGIGPGTALVGIGSVCRRHLHGPDGVIAIMEALDDVLPHGTRVHLYGLKGNSLAALARFAHRIESTDSMAYDMAVRRSTPVGRTQYMRAVAMVEWHAREMQRLHQGPRNDPPALLVTRRDRSPVEVASEAVGACLGDLHRSNDVSYRDAKAILAQDVVTVQALMRAHGVEAFAAEEPEDDFGLGMVYAEVRSALVGAGYLPATA